MKFTDLFKSSRELEQEKKRARREKERKVERAIDNISDRLKALDSERTKIWDKARTLLQNGQKMEATRLVQTYKALGVQAQQYERQRIFAQNQLAMLTGAEDMKQITTGIGELADMQGISVEEIEANLDKVAAAGEDIKDINRVMNKAYEKDIERLTNEADALSDPAVDADLMAALENEAAAGVLGGRVADAPAATTPQQATADINAGRNRLSELLNGK